MKRLLAFAMMVASIAQARADAVSDFYRNKTVFLMVGSGTGGVYDLVGRLIARHIGKYIPGEPKVVPQNVPGGGSLMLANQFAAITPRDGTAFGIFNNGMPTTPLLDPQAGKFDPRKFNFLGSPSRETHILVAWKTAPAQTFDDLFRIETILGATSPGAAPYDFPLLTNALIGTKFKIVTGYPGGAETQLAMRRGEIHANGGLALQSYQTDYQDAIAAGDVKILAGFGMHPHPALPDTPYFPTGKNDEERQLFQLMYARQDYGRPLAMPEGVPKERVAAMRAAVQKVLRDPALIDEATRMKADIDPVSGEELEALTQRIFQTPAETVARMQQIISSGK